VERRIFFPWEGRGAVRQFLALGRVGPALLLASVLLFVLWVAKRERHFAGVRVTQVAVASLKAPVERFLLENDGRCPDALADVLPYAPFVELPLDGWGRPIRIVCPSQQSGVDYILMSDGPDGLPGGLDRVEF
jgi:general secretion pathway protein G